MDFISDMIRVITRITSCEVDRVLKKSPEETFLNDRDQQSL